MNASNTANVTEVSVECLSWIVQQLRAQAEQAESDEQESRTWSRVKTTLAAGSTAAVLLFGRIFQF